MKKRTKSDFQSFIPYLRQKFTLSRRYLHIQLRAHALSRGIQIREVSNLSQNYSSLTIGSLDRFVLGQQSEHLKYMTKQFKENYLTQENGCLLLHASSQREGAPAANLLTDSRKHLWVIQDPLPQHCIIDTSNLRNYPKVFNRIGFYCWHEYESNPELIEVAYGKDEQSWTVAGKIRLERTSEKQYFKIKEIPVTEMKMLKITVMKNFGDRHTYLNQVQLGYVKENGLNETGTREKTFSEFVKLTSTQRELKRALQQIRVMSAEQEELKATVKKQHELMTKMQESMKQIAKHMTRMQETQQIQAAKIKVLEQKRPSKRNEKVSDRPQHTNPLSSESDDLKNYIEDAFISKKPRPNNPNKSTSFTKSNRQISSKQEKIRQYAESKKTSKMQSLLKSRQIYNDSDPNLSEYNTSEDEKSRHSEKCSELVHKLQRLLIEKEKRQRQLSRKGNRAG